MAARHAKGSRRQPNSQRDQRVSLENLEERTSRSWVRLSPRLSLTCRLTIAICRYGHGVLRNPDPRFIALQEFCDTRPELYDSPIIRLVKKVCSCKVIVIVGRLHRFCSDFRSCSGRAP
jgi:hypothetical protein